MNGVKFLKPKYDDLIIRDPISKNPLSQKGELKPWSGREGTFWRRRVKDGSAIITEKEIPSIVEGKNIKKKKKKGGS